MNTIENEINVIKKIKQLINEKYDAQSCGLTEQRSHGNSYDVFTDGMQCGESQVLYEIGILLGMELEEPHEQDWE